MINDFQIQEIIAELQREVVIRHRVFPDWVASGRLPLIEAERRIALMEAAIELIETKCQDNQQTLF